MNRTLEWLASRPPVDLTEFRLESAWTMLAGDPGAWVVAAFRTNDRLRNEWSFFQQCRRFAPAPRGANLEQFYEGTL